MEKIKEESKNNKTNSKITKKKTITQNIGVSIKLSPNNKEYENKNNVTPNSPFYPNNSNLAMNNSPKLNSEVAQKRIKKTSTNRIKDNPSSIEIGD